MRPVAISTHADAAAPVLSVAFRGWFTVRLATDPDPTDDPRGASGWTFAFGHEPDLDRLLRFQPQEDRSRLRPGAPWRWGVAVEAAYVSSPSGGTRRIGMRGSKVRLFGEPKLEGRNQLLTQPGFEPIIPFDLGIELPGGGLLRRDAPLPSPTYQLSAPLLAAHGASGGNPEPSTYGACTGIWDVAGLLAERKRTLTRMLRGATGDTKARLLGRIAELEIGITNPSDIRAFSHTMVERFSFELDGPRPRIPRSGALARLDPSVPWDLQFLMTGFDADTLGAYVLGALRIPFRS
ncbi:MAG TPA: hypothetical protein VGZ03_05630 [Acidimicrobiales bacterium]|nr:hypothetical protein [Acidimicrobiales bacterium]